MEHCTEFLGISSPATGTALEQSMRVGWALIFLWDDYVSSRVLYRAWTRCTCTAALGCMLLLH